MDGAFPRAEDGLFATSLALFDTPVFVFDVIEAAEPEFRFAEINKAYERDTGAKRDQLVGLMLDDALPKRQADVVRRNYMRCLEAGTSITYEEVLEFAQGECWWLTTLTPVKDPETGARHIVGITRDITEQKTREQELILSMAELTGLNGELRTLTAMAAHDLRGPLGTLESVLDLLMEDFVDMGDGKTELMNAGRDLIQSLRPQIDLVLQRALALDTPQAPEQEVDLGHLCGDLAALIDPRGNLRIDFPMLVVRADAVALQMVLRNLFDNARRHARNRIEVTVAPAGGGMVQFTVADDGPGLNPETLSVGPKEGRGFGLTAVRHMVQSRGGTLDMEEHGPLNGLATRFTLPGDFLS